MTPAPRPLTAAELREVRDASRRQARAMSGIGLALIGVALTAFTMLVIIVLDYRFHQPFYRVAKVLAAGTLGLFVMLTPMVGLFAFPIILPYLSWIPPIPVPGMNTLNLLLGTVFSVWAINRVMRGEPLTRSSRLGGTIAAMIAMIAWGVVRGAAFPIPQEYDLLNSALSAFRGSLSLAVFFVFLLMIRGSRARRGMIWAIVLGVAAESVTTILLGRTGRGARAVGSIGQSNELGTYLALGAIIASAMIPATRNWLGKIFLGVVCAAAVFGVILSLSRASIIALFLGLLYVTARSARGLAVVLILVTLTGPIWAPDYLRDRMTGTTVETEGYTDVELDNAAQIRVNTWRVLISIIENHLLDGVGWDGVHQLLPESAQSMVIDAVDTSHNTYFRILAEMGIFGLALFVWLLWKCWALGLAAARVARTTFDRQLGIAVCATTIVVAIACAFGDRFLNVVIIGGFWATCALAEDALHEARAAAPSPQAPS